MIEFAFQGPLLKYFDELEILWLLEMSIFKIIKNDSTERLGEVTGQLR